MRSEGRWSDLEHEAALELIDLALASRGAGVLPDGDAAETANALLRVHGPRITRRLLGTAVPLQVFPGPVAPIITAPEGYQATLERVLGQAYQRRWREESEALRAAARMRAVG